jgi:tight adherence protein B
MKVRVATAILLVAVFAGPAALAAAPAKRPVVALQLTPVGKTPFPERMYVVDVSSGGAINPNRVHVVENGIGIGQGEFTFTTLANSKVTSATILAIDASDSMRGNPEAGAFAAARTFVAKRRGNQEVGVVVFNGGVNVLRAPTINTGQLRSALAAPPKLSYGTHLFDAVRRSLRTLASSGISAGSIVILSDGSDIGSTYTLQQVVRAAQAQNVRVFTVGLRSGAFDGKTLRQLATQTGGAYAEATSASELAGIYSKLGSKLSGEYLLDYHSLAAPSSPVDVEVTVDGVGKTTTHYVAPTPSQLPPYHRPFFRTLILSGWSLFLLALVVAALIGFAVRLALNAARSRFVERIRLFSGDTAEAEAEAQAKAKEEEDWRRRATRARASGSAAARGWMGRLDEQIDIGRIKVSSMTIVVVTAVMTVLMVLVLGTISILFAVLGLGTPLVSRAWVRWKVRKVREEFSDQLPPNLQVLTAGLRAGFTMLGAFVAMVENADEPSKSEFSRAITDERLGIPLEEAIRKVSVRMVSRDLEQVAMLAELLRTTGGNAAEVLDVIVLTVRERHDIRRLVRTLTTQGRMARWILTALPIATGLAFWALQPDIVGPMWRSTIGQLFLLVAAIMVATGSYVIQKIIEIEV